MKSHKYTAIKSLKNSQFTAFKKEKATIADNKLNYLPLYENRFNIKEEDQIDNRTMQLIALTIVNAIGCPNQDAAHRFAAAELGISNCEIEEARAGVSADPKIQAAMNFANKILQCNGQIPEPSIGLMRNSGYSEDSVSEIVALCIVKMMF